MASLLTFLTYTTLNLKILRKIYEFSDNFGKLYQKLLKVTDENRYSSEWGYSSWAEGSSPAGTSSRGTLHQLTDISKI